MSFTFHNSTRILAALGCVISLFVHAATLSAQDTSDGELRRVYVPVEDLEAVLARDRRGVLLPREEFEQLYEAARQNAQGRSPDALVVSGADYTARIAGDQLVLNAEIRFTNFAEGWTQMVLPAAGLGVEQATLDGAAARLGRDAEQADRLVLYVDEPGPHTLALELSSPLNAVGSDQAAAFSLAGAPTGELSVALPAGKFLTVDGLQLERPAAEDEAAEYRLPIGGRGQIALRITDRQREAAGETLVFANTAFGVYVAPGEVTWNTRSSLQVYGRAIDRLVCRVPAALEITDVESTGLESWELADDPDTPGRTMITLLFRQPFDGTRDVTFRGSQSSDETWRVPTLELENVTSHVGVVVVQHPPGVRIQPVAASGVRPVALENIEHAATTLKYEVWQPDFNLAFTAVSKERDVHAAMTNVLDINAGGLDLFTTLDVQTFFAPLFDVRLRLPAGWTITSVTVAGQPADWQVVPLAAGVNEIRIPLPSPLAAGQTHNLSLTAHQDLEDWPPEENTVSLPIPEVSLPQAGVVEALYGVTADDDLDVVPGNVNGLDPARADDVALLNNKLQALGRQVRLGFTYQDTVFTGQLDVARKPSRVAVATVTFFRVDRETLFSHLEARLHIEGGGERTLEVAVSESAGTDLRFQLLRPFELIRQQQAQGLFVPFDAVRIVEQTPSDPVDGMRTWTLQLDRRARGDLVLMVDVQTPKPEADSYAPHVLNVLNADRQSGHIAVEAGAEQHVEITATGDDGQPLQSVDPVDFPAAYYRPVERVVAGYLYVRPGWTLAVSENRYEREAVPTAVVHSAKLQSVLSLETEEEDGRASVANLQHEAELIFTAVGIQSLKLTFADENAHLWATLIDGNPVEVRDADGAYLVTLPATADPARPRTLSLFYQTHVESSGELRQQPPVVTAVTGSGAEQPIEILEQEWTLYHSPDTLIVDSEGRFHPVGDLDRSSLLGRLQRSFSAPSPRELGASLVAVLFAVVIIWVLTLGYRRFRWLGVVLAVAILLGVMVVLTVPTVQNARRAAVATSETQPRLVFGINEDMSEMSAEYGDYEYSEAGAEMPTGADLAMPPADFEGEARNREQLLEAARNARDRVEEFQQAQQPSEQQLQFRQQESEQQRSVDQSLRHDLEGVVPSAPTPDMAAGPGEATTRTPVASSSDGLRGGTDVPFQQGSFELGVPDFGGFAEVPLAQAPGGQQAGQAMGGAGVTTLADGTTRFVSRGALLSLIIKLQPPDGAIARSFRYFGTAGTEEPATLDITYADRTGGGMLTLLIAAGLTLICWIMRKASPEFRVKLGALVIAGPLALMTIAPAGWLPVLDGLFLGGLCGVALWMLRACAPCCLEWCQSCCRRSPETKTTTTTTAATVLLVGLVLTCNTARAQESGDPFMAPEQPLPPAIIVPYKPGTDPTTAERVFLPQHLFLKLWNQAHPEDRRTAPAPLNGLVSEALYVAELVADGDDSRVSVTGRYLLHNLSKGQVTLSLPLGNVAVQTATLDGASAPLIVADGAISVVVNEPGAHVLDLQFDVPARITGPAGQFTLPLKPIAAGRLSFTLPDEENLVVRVGGATGNYRLVEEETRRSVEAPVAQGGDITVAWQPKQTQAAIGGIVHVEAATAVKVDDAGLHLSTGLQYSVPQGALSEVSFSLPVELSLQSISGADVGGWEVADDGDSRTLRVFFRRSIDEQTQLTINLFQPLVVEDAGVSFDVPQVVPQNITREIGVLAMYAAPQFTLRVDQASGLSQINFDRFTAPVMPSPPVYDPPNARAAYRYTSRPIQISATVARRETETRAVAEHAANVGLRKLIVASRIQYELTGAPRPSVSVALPDGYLPVDVTATYLTDWYVTDGAAGRVLTVELDQPRLGRIDVLLEGHLVKQPEDATLAVPLPDPLEVSRLQSSLAVWLDPAYTASLQSFDDWRSIDPQQLSEAVRALQPRAVQFAFRSDEADPADVVLNLSRAAPELSGEAITLIAVSDASLDYGLNLRWRITRAAADTFVLTTPDWLGGRLEFQAEGIRQVTSTDTGDGRLRWTISLVDPVRDQFLLTGVATLPPPEDQQVLAPDLQFEQADVDGTFAALETQSQFAVLVNLSSWQVTSADVHETVPASALPLQVSEVLVNQAMDIVRVTAGNPPVWQLERLELAEAANATVTGAELTTVLDYDGSWRTQAVYTVRNRGRQFLALKLPEGARVLSVFVRGAPSRTVETTLGEQAVHLIALPQTSAADLSFPIRVILAGRLATSLPEHFGVMARKIDIPVPTVVTPDEAAAGGQPDLGMPVVQTQWTIDLPDGIDGEADKTNLTDTGTTADFRMQQLMEDFEALKRVAVSPVSSASQRSRAMNNLKQLGLAMHNYHDVARGDVQSAEDLDREIAELTASRGRVLIDIDESESMSQQELGRRYVVGNTADIAASNAPAPGKESGVVSGLNFNDLAGNESVSGVIDEANRAKDTGDRGALRSQIEQQAIVTDGQSNTIAGGGPMAGMGGGGGIGGFGGGGGGEGFGADFDSLIDRIGQEAQQAAGTPGYESMHAPQIVSGFVIPAQAAAPDANGNGVIDTAGVALPAWTTAGGLSLDMAIPVTENKLTFSKVGGQPQLTLDVRSRKTLTLGIGALWTLLWVVIGVWAARTLARAGAAGHSARALPKILIAVGLLGFFLLPGDVRWAAFTVFVVSALIFAFQHRVAAPRDSSAG